MPPYTLETLIQEMTEVVSAQSDAKLVIDGVSEGLRRLIAAPFFLEERQQRPSPDGIARHELHRDPAGRFSLVAVVWSPGQSTPIHDHGTWGVIAGVSQRVIATAYRRVDDGATPGFASLAESTRSLVSEVNFAFVRPGEEEIHKLENPFREPAVTLHAFGAEPVGQSYFDTRAKSLMTVEAAWTLGV